MVGGVGLICMVATGRKVLKGSTPTKAKVQSNWELLIDDHRAVGVRSLIAVTLRQFSLTRSRCLFSTAA